MGTIHKLEKLELYKIGDSRILNVEKYNKHMIYWCTRGSFGDATKIKVYTCDSDLEYETLDMRKVRKNKRCVSFLDCNITCKYIKIVYDYSNNTIPPKIGVSVLSWIDPDD